MYQRRGGNVRAITVFVKTAIRSLQRCIRQRKPPDARKIERSLLSSAPGLVGGTEFSTVRFRGDRAKAAKLYEGADALTPEDIAETIHWIATLPPRVNVNAIELMPVTQAFGPLVVHREDRPAEILERS
jgi:NADP-dependent 3-hydroxy acid dehydrogenase YdfG